LKDQLTTIYMTSDDGVGLPEGEATLAWFSYFTDGCYFGDYAVNFLDALTAY
jgi:hypothetical protein